MPDTGKDKKLLGPVDLGLTYLEAMHGVQTGVKFEIESKDERNASSPKHLRTGINSAMLNQAAIACLLIKKGIITEAEYLEEIRLWANNELDMFEKHHGIGFR
jgi:hypothetical protein